MLLTPAPIVTAKNAWPSSTSTTAVDFVSGVARSERSTLILAVEGRARAAIPWTS
jgi:hypothetical protein